MPVTVGLGSPAAGLSWACCSPCPHWAVLLCRLPPDLIPGSHTGAGGPPLPLITHGEASSADAVAF